MHTSLNTRTDSTKVDHDHLGRQHINLAQKFKLLKAKNVMLSQTYHEHASRIKRLEGADTGSRRHSDLFGLHSGSKNVNSTFDVLQTMQTEQMSMKDSLKRQEERDNALQNELGEIRQRLTFHGGESSRGTQAHDCPALDDIKRLEAMIRSLKDEVARLDARVDDHEVDSKTVREEQSFTSQRMEKTMDRVKSLRSQTRRKHDEGCRDV